MTRGGTSPSTTAPETPKRSRTIPKKNMKFLLYLERLLLLLRRFTTFTSSEECRKYELHFPNFFPPSEISVISINVRKGLKEGASNKAFAERPEKCLGRKIHSQFCHKLVFGQKRKEGAAQPGRDCSYQGCGRADPGGFVGLDPQNSFQSPGFTGRSRVRDTERRLQLLSMPKART